MSSLFIGQPSAPAQLCVDCGIMAPPTETNYTLISARFGWRLTIRQGPGGERNPEWRCPACWEVFKAPKK